MTGSEPVALQERPERLGDLQVAMLTEDETVVGVGSERLVRSVEPLGKALDAGLQITGWGPSSFSFQPSANAVAALPEAFVAGRANTPFDVPEGVSFVEIDGETGMLATPRCPNIKTEVFLAGTEPTEPCLLHQF